MPEYSEILRSLDADKFTEVLAASSRQARETYFHRHGVKASAGKQRFQKPGAKNVMRAKALREVLMDKDDDEMAEEILRTWLLTQRPMLAAALDHLGIPHNNGLTEGDLSKFEKLGGREAKALAKVLADAGAPADAVAIYLKFMGVSDVDKIVQTPRD